MFREACLSLVACCLLGSSALAQPSSVARLNAMDLERAKVMLKQAHDDLARNYYDPAYHGVDIETTYRQFNERLNTAQSVNESFRIIAAYYLNLHDSHLFFLPPQRVNRSTMGYLVEMIGDHAFITRVRPGSDAANKLHPGDEILALNNFKVRRADFNNMEYFFTILSPAPAQTIELLSPTGERRQETVKAMLRPGRALMDITGDSNGDYMELVRGGEDEDHLNRERFVSMADTFIWRMPSFEVEPSVMDSVFSKASGKKHLIIDLRSNPGGDIATLKAALGHLFDHEVKLADRVTRKDNKPEIIKTRGHVYTGTVTVLIDSKSASCSELFARVIQIEHRGKVIGDRSEGAVMEARGFPNALGAYSVIYYGFSITSANLIMADGKSLESTGVTPDELLLPTAADLAAARDPVLAHAAEMAGTPLDPAAAGKLFPFEWPTL